MHQEQALVPNRSAFVFVLIKSHFEWRIAAEQFVGPLPAQGNTIAIAVHLFGSEQRADRSPYQIWLE